MAEASKRVTDPAGFIDGLELIFNTVSIVDIESGLAMDSNGEFFIDNPSTVSVNITTSGAGGLDTGSESADTWYAVHVIADSTGANVTAGLLSLSATAPTLPSGYDIFRFVGNVRNNSSANFYKWFQTGTGKFRKIRWDESMESPTILIVLAAGSALVFTNVDVSEFVSPTSERSELHLLGNVRDGFVRPDGSVENFARFLLDQPIIYDIPCPGQIIEYTNDTGGGPAGALNITVLGYYEEL